jgi:hypothetical protein
MDLSSTGASATGTLALIGLVLAAARGPCEFDLGLAVLVDTEHERPGNGARAKLGDTHQQD